MCSSTRPEDGNDLPPNPWSGGERPLGASQPGASQPSRLSRPELFMGVAKLFGRRSSCPRASVGCIATLEGRIIASGYVGAPHGQPHCVDVGCQLEDGHCVRTIHAESNLVAWAARTGTSLLGSTVWSTHSPCRKCAQLLANVGVAQMWYDLIYDTSILQYCNQELNLPLSHWSLSESRG